ncbi:hypothetical protein GV827_19825 [Sulfitobacter sp. JBTF-M27]|uniref:Uncharacterized protein n=1 Tax=Sulfitobacter sediminilitoris TaxID=2698830 RepID=A0A6P0CEM2_9RHOB|nr:hypothetical protein [Sulfitobacter sediminilitoris]NEK24632.1 hypothetical protein [Sulfitobacter sediminilitoris]
MSVECTSRLQRKAVKADTAYAKSNGEKGGPKKAKKNGIGSHERGEADIGQLICVKGSPPCLATQTKGSTDMCKNLLTVYLKSIMKALVLFAIGMFALPNDARAQCGDVPNSQYNTFEINFSLSMAEFPLIPDCAAGNMASCQEAFTQLYEADVAINQGSIRNSVYEAQPMQLKRVIC